MQAHTTLVVLLLQGKSPFCTQPSYVLSYSRHLSSFVTSDPNSGHWSKDETKRLIQAVEETLREKCKLDEEEADEDKILSILRQHLYKGLPWVKIEAKVGTRNWNQCKEKW